MGSVRRPLSGDQPLRLVEKLEWFGRNAAAAGAGEVSALVGRRLRALAPAEALPGALSFIEPSGRASLESSPGRLLSIHVTLRVCALLNARVAESISVIDIGCGSGGFAPFFRAHLDRFGCYVGVDVQRHSTWEDLAAPDVSFREESAESLLDAEALLYRFGDMGSFAFVHSNSALEHVLGDKQVVRQLASWARRRPERVAQLHVLPASAALPLYRTHGYRVYSRRDVALLARELEPARVQVIGLGGMRSWLVHFLHLREREHYPERYGARLLSACDHDVARGGRLMPIMWAVLATPAVWRR
jgi:SAM-dependent methyltransferase